MQRVYCWRCKKEVAAFDQAEYAELTSIYSHAKDRALEIGLEASSRERHASFLNWYARVTGQTEIDAQQLGDVLKHRLWTFGPRCLKCGRNLRTPQARKCFECGWNRNR
jgi:hypothetical protein